LKGGEKMGKDCYDVRDFQSLEELDVLVEQHSSSVPKFYRQPAIELMSFCRIDGEVICGGNHMSKDDLSGRYIDFLFRYLDLELYINEELSDDVNNVKEVLMYRKDLRDAITCIGKKIGYWRRNIPTSNYTEQSLALINSALTDDFKENYALRVTFEKFELLNVRDDEIFYTVNSVNVINFIEELKQIKGHIMEKYGLFLTFVEDDK
jgi:hypothetical protein